MTTFWLSYAEHVAQTGPAVVIDLEKDIGPSDDGFLGVVIVDGEDFLDAVRRAKGRGSPGGQIRGLALDPAVASLVPVEYRDRRLTKAEIEVLNGLMEAQLAGQDGVGS